MASYNLNQALPVRSGGSILRVVSNEQLDAEENERNLQEERLNQPEDAVHDSLANHIRARMQDMRNFRNAEGISERLLHALRTYKGMYSQAKLAEIRQFGGSDVYARVTATKCRAATALLRDVYLGPERPWEVKPTPDPVVPMDIEQMIQQLVNIEVQTNAAAGVPTDPAAIEQRVGMLRIEAQRAAKKQAHDEAEKATRKLDDILTEGGFYEAFAEFLIDLPIFPYACIKGPEVRRHKQTKWVNGQPIQESIPKMFWRRVSPFDIYWSPGADKVQSADFIERIKVTRAELQNCKGLPGYNDDAIDKILEISYVDGLHEWWDTIDTERAELEDRERWARTATSLIDTAEFTGHISGRMLQEWGLGPDQVPDPLGEYFVTAWLIDRYVIKVHINPSTQQRAPYYISAFEQIPGAMLGYGLVDLLEDVQTICNASARSLVNNASISSGPQVVINNEVLQPGENDNLFPWKRWHVSYDPTVASGKPIDFFQPNMNAAELMGIFKEWSMLGDEISSIPRYMTGNEKVGGAGRTASGLAMLMGNASKTLQNVAASIDRDVVNPLLKQLYDMIMLTTPNALRGDEQIVVKGVNHAVKREQDRMRQLEFLQLTANPIDQQIIGPVGRANILRSVAQNLGLEHERTVPDDEEIQTQIQAQQQAMAAQAQMQQAAQGGGDPNQQPAPKDARAGPEQAREGIEGDFTGPTGRPGMRMGG